MAKKKKEISSLRSEAAATSQPNPLAPTKEELEFIARASALTILVLESVINSRPKLKQILQPALLFANGGLDQVAANLGREETFEIAAKVQDELEAVANEAA